MRIITLLVLLLLAAGNASFAQVALPAAAEQVGQPSPTDSPRVRAATTASLSDSMRQTIHKLFKRGRLFGTISAVSGGVLLGSGTGYALSGESFRNTGFSIIGGVSALVIGTMNMVQFSRRREREVIAALERGQPLPRYAVRWMPLVGK
ncbi:hypothetical protein Q3A66_02045 [Hymenobacter sp. BT770]|uniref:hypothetical protein n=1 Tax=Hymenobacter sp. BT770 TaxID=2886942 RepID=UPI001D100597|nr:hypothetical protein [Hymenobacter sp. BT770]MCC3151590.1 hypothetical protein [Hymenobacter sp. BT770]MDO3413833.1 hypothetical protein [Hymenobacter sp. BT770]